MTEAGFIADWSNDLDLLLLVRDGNVALDAAYKQAKARKDKADWDAEQERKKREREIAVNDAELAALLSLAHNQLTLDRTLINAAQDKDNWHGVLSLSPKVIAMWKQLEEKANAQLAN